MQAFDTMDYKNETGPKKRLRDTNRKTIDLEHLTLSSYVRLSTMIAVCLGLLVSAIFFIVDLAGVDTSIHWGSLNIAHTEAGFVFLFIGPFIFAAAGFVESLLSYRLFTWTLRRFQGLTLTGNWKEIVPPEVGGETKHGHPQHGDKFT